ncbi:MAG: hypothetical protein ACTSSE_11325 [Candidatus Thorarchaeota archaeon]
MASTSSTMTMSKRIVSLQALTSIMESLDEQDQKNLEPFIPEIEEQVRVLIGGVPEEKLGRRKESGLLAAAIYDACLALQKRTMVRVGVTTIAESVGVAPCNVSRNWRSLFDDRVEIDMSRVERVGRGESDPSLIVTDVVHTIQRAVVEMDEDLAHRFKQIRKQAKALIRQLDKKDLSGYYPDVIASTAVWSVIREEGKSRVQLSQRDASLLCNVSEAMISKVWSELFKMGSRSSVQT